MGNRGKRRKILFIVLSTDLQSEKEINGRLQAFDKLSETVERELEIQSQTKVPI